MDDTDIRTTSLSLSTRSQARIGRAGGVFVLGWIHRGKVMKMSNKRKPQTNKDRIE